MKRRKYATLKKKRKSLRFGSTENDVSKKSDIYFRYPLSFEMHTEK